MSDLTGIERIKLERLFKMGDGYVLSFSNRTFADFVLEKTGRLIYDDPQYAASGESKAKRLRTFWRVESNHVAAKLIEALIDYEAPSPFEDDETTSLRSECRKIVERLRSGVSVEEIDALTAEAQEPEFEVIAQQVRDALERNKPEAGLDRLHTYSVKFVRTICQEHGIATPRDKPLHSLFGECVKRLRDEGHLQSEMSVRILKSSISVLEAFNDVRNNQSLAHDNPILDSEEARLIFNHVTGSIRFLRCLEARIKTSRAVDGLTGEKLPF